MPGIKNSFDLLGNYIVGLSTENDVFRHKASVYEEIWLAETKSKLLCDMKERECEKRANFIITRVKKQSSK